MNPIPDWLHELDEKLVTVHLNGNTIGRGQLFLFGMESGSHCVDLWCCLIVITDKAVLKLEGKDTLCITCKTE